MRICHVITRLIIGGAQENTIWSCHGLAELGHEVTLAAGVETGPEGSLWPEAQACGAALERLKFMRRAVRPMQDWRAVCELTALFRRTQPDVVHTHSSKAGIIGRWAAVRADVPLIVHTIHGMSFNRTQSPPTRMLYRLLERRAAKYTSALVSVADAMTDQAVAAGVAPRDRFVTIRSGMDTSKYTPDARRRPAIRRAWGAGDGDVVVGTVARLFVNKGYEQIMDAMPAIVASVPSVRFVWIGGGPYVERYQRRLISLGLRDRVVFTGLIHPDEVATAINGLDVMLHASMWEGLPRVLVQGLLTEVPAVTFDNDGAAEIVFDDQTGILVPLGDTGR